MDYRKIRLSNERNSHVVKRMNRLGIWKFFRVLYRDNMWRLFGFSLLMLLCLAPIVAIQLVSSFQISTLHHTMPIFNSFGFSTGIWEGMGEYYAAEVAHHNVIFGLYTVACSALMFVVFSGGFAVIRDSFWTGKMSTVGVFKSIGKGIAANFGYALASVAIIGFGVFGVVMFYNWLVAVLGQALLWLAIVLTVLVSLVLFLLACYLMILCSVSVTYKQSVFENLDDSWRLLWLNILPNIIHLALALLPVPLYFIFGQNTGFLQTIFMVLVFMFGGMYFPLVWHTHMMKTFALFHPVEPKKKKEVKREIQERALAEAQAQAAAAEQAAAERARKKAVKKGKKPVAASPDEIEAPAGEVAEVQPVAEVEPIDTNPDEPIE